MNTLSKYKFLMKVILIQILLLLNISSFSQHFVWAKSASSFAPNRLSINDMVVDSLGSIYVTGGFYGNVNLDDTFFTANGICNGYVAKLDTGWNVEWIKTFSSGNYTNCTAIDISKTGELYIIGTFDGTLQIDTIQLISLGSTDIFFAKYDTSGIFKIAGSIGSASSDEGKGIATSNGYFALCGKFSDTIFFPDTIISPIVIEGSCECSFVVLYDSIGNYKWSKYGANIIDMNDSFIITSSQYVVYDSQMNQGQLSNVKKYDYNGTMLWKTEPTLVLYYPCYILSNDIAFDNEGNIYLCGLFVGPTIWDTISISSAPPSTFLTKYSSTGVPQWVRKISGDPNNPNPKITINNNFIYLNSSFSNFPAYIGNDTLITMGQDDIYIVKLDKFNNLFWSKRYGGNQNEMVSSIAVTNDNIVFTAGYSYSNPVLFDDKIVSNGYFIAKLDTLHYLNIPNYFNENISIYPNPSIGSFQVKGEGIISIVVTDMVGREILSTEQHTFDLGSFGSGIYNARITTKNGSTDCKLVVIH